MSDQLQHVADELQKIRFTFAQEPGTINEPDLPLLDVYRPVSLF